MAKERLVGLDVVRTTAIAFVVVLHSISLLEIMDTNMLSPIWSVFLLLRQLTLSCVPLFLLLSGFLQRNKRLSKSYYFGIVPLYLSYFVISALCMVAYTVNGAVTGNQDITFVTAVYKIFNFTADGYAWYFEMYFGLFLLIPFLNMAYNAVGTKNGKLFLIGILAVLTLLPDTIAGFAPYYDGSGSTVSLNIFPDFFKSLYPVTYYYMGAFIGEYRPKLRLSAKIVSVAVAVFVPSALCFCFTAMRSSYAWYMMNGFQTITACATAIAVFVSLYDAKIKSEVAGRIFALISVSTFEMYLLSYIFDNAYYGRILIWQPFMAILVFVSSLVAAIVLRKILSPVNRLLRAGYDKLFEI